MLGRTHVSSAWCAGLAVSPLLGMHDTAQTVLFSAVMAGYAAVPDLDHTKAKASRLLGPVTGTLSLGVRWLSGHIYQATKGPRDEDWSGKHRHLTHTLIVAALLGALAAWGTSGGGPWSVVAVALFGLVLAVDCLGDGAVGDFVLFGALAAAVLWWTSVGSIAVLAGMQGWIGWAVFLGCLVHDLGDACTISGVPILWPLPIDGETWWEVKLLGPFSLHTGHWAERHIAFPAFVIAGVLLVPGVWPVAVDGVGHVLAVVAAR